MIIGIAGKLGTGKTTVAKYAMQILAENDIPSIRMSFADILKAEAAQIYGFPLDAAYDNKQLRVALPKTLAKKYRNPSWPDMPTVREILQYYGTDVTRAKDSEYWVKALDAKYQTFDEGTIVFIDDVRFPNEKKYAEEHGCCYRIKAYPGYPHASVHPSECALDTHAFVKIFDPGYGELAWVGETIAQDALEMAQNQAKSPSM